MPRASKSDVRRRVMAAARDSQRARFWGFSRQLAAGVTAFTVMSGGLAYAANQAMPSDALYPLKRAGENVLIWLLPSGALEHGMLVKIAARRAEEASALSTGDEGQVGEALRELERAVEQAAERHDGVLSPQDSEQIRERIEPNDAPAGQVIDKITAPGPIGTQPGPAPQPQPGPGEPADTGTPGSGTSESPGPGSGSDGSGSDGPSTTPGNETPSGPGR
jgi:hypothetical protein